MAHSGSYQVSKLMWIGMVMGVHAAMSDAERAELAQWERRNVTGDGRLSSTDWPGFVRYLPDKPKAAPRKTPPKARIPSALRKAVFERDAYRCRQCGSHQELCADHIYPESRGGATTLDNLQTLCRPCNTRKGASLPATREGVIRLP